MDSIWCICGTENLEKVYTGGKDGYIFEIDVIKDQIKTILKGSIKQPIISIQLDEKNQKLWYSSTNSEIHCLDISTDLQNNEYLKIEGLPHITESQ